MEIVWYGHSCFRFIERGMSSIVTDPFNHEIVGFDPLRLKADIVTVSHDAPGHNFTSGVKGFSHKLTGAGEFEIGGVFITGVMTEGKKNGDSNNVLYHFDFDGLTVVHLGDVTQIPTQGDIETLGNVNIALVPVGGGNSLNASKAAEVISLIEPNIVIPMHYAVPGSKLNLDPITKFLKEMGIASLEAVPSLKVTRSNLGEDTKVVVLDANRNGAGKEEA